MAKRPHKFAWNGVDIDTVLSASNLAAICAQAALESTGDLWNGKQRIAEVEDGDGWTLYVVKNAILAWQKFMTFSVDISSDSGRTKLKTTIHTYTTTQQTVIGFIPVTPKKMVAHHTYMQFVHKVANTVHAADSSARITIREGVEVPGMPAIPMSSGTSPAVPSVPVPPAIAAAMVPDAVASALAPLAPPPPPPATALAPPPPPPTPQAPPVVAIAAAPVEPAGELDDSTRKVPRRPRSMGGWELVLPDGTAVRLGARIVIGRDPASTAPGDDILIPVPDSERLVSKTHAAFGMTDGHPYVTDLHSANGTFLLAPNGSETQCEPGVEIPLRDGWQVELGSYPIAVRAVRFAR